MNAESTENPCMSLAITVNRAYISLRSQINCIWPGFADAKRTHLPMTPKAKIQRPVFFSLMQIQMPVGAITSILHRVTGVLLALGLPLSLYLLELSLKGPQGYERVAVLFDYWEVKILALLYTWALAHHLLAGVRHLLSDIDVGAHLPAARASAWLVNGGAVVIALLSLGALL